MYIHVFPWFHNMLIITLNIYNLFYKGHGLTTTEVCFVNIHERLHVITESPEPPKKTRTFPYTGC